MKDKPEYNRSNHTENKNHTADNARPLENTSGIYPAEEPGIPKRENKTWCSYMERGFRASRVICDQQAVIHSDTPEEAHDGEISMNQIQPDEIMD